MIRFLHPGGYQDAGVILDQKADNFPFVYST